MEQVITQAKRDRMKLYDDMSERYRELAANPNNQTTAIVDKLAEEFKVCVSTVYNMRRSKKLYKKRLDRNAIVRYHDDMIANGETPSEAKKKAAAKFDCTLAYVYTLVNYTRS